MRRGLKLLVCGALGCNGTSKVAEAEGSGDGEGSSGMPEWEDGAPGATCPEEYDPDRVYVTMQQARYHSWLWVVRDLDEQEVECSYKWEGNDFLDAIVHPGRRALLLSMETRDGFELRLPAPRAVRRLEPDDPSEFIWELVPAPNDDVTMFAITDDPQTFCGDVLRRWWPDATVMFSCSGWQDETGMPRLDDYAAPYFDGEEGEFTLAGGRILVHDQLYDLAALDEQRSDYQPVRLDYGPESSIRVLSARSLSSGTDDVIVVRAFTGCFDCETPSDLVLRRLLLSGNAIVDEREYIWPHEVELEPEQVALDGEGRWVAHVQEPGPDGGMFDRVIRGELDGSETLLIEGPSLVDFETTDPTAVRIGRVFSGA